MPKCLPPLLLTHSRLVAISADAMDANDFQKAPKNPLFPDPAQRVTIKTHADFRAQNDPHEKKCLKLCLWFDPVFLTSASRKRRHWICFYLSDRKAATIWTRAEKFDDITNSISSKSLSNSSQCESRESNLKLSRKIDIAIFLSKPWASRWLDWEPWNMPFVIVNL